MSDCANPLWPNPVNICTDDTYGAGYDIRHYCTLGGVGGDGSRDEWCQKFSDGEWISLQEGPGCLYCATHNQELEARCDGIHAGCGAGIAGRGASCQRTRFAGSAGWCCHRDMMSSLTDDTHKISIEHDFNNGKLGDWTDNVYCFEDSSRMRTCPPKYRDIASPDCYKDLYAAECAGRGKTHDEFKKMLEQNWQDSSALYDRDTIPDPSDKRYYPCYFTLARQVLGPENWNLATATLEVGLSPDPTLINPETYGQARIMIQELHDNFIKYGYNMLAPVGSPGHHPFGNKLFSICRASPGLCQNFLNDTCRGITMEEASKDPIKQMVCGCYLNESEYDHYENDLGIGNRSCVPICNNTNAIPLSSGDAAQVCSATICIMDDITVNMVNSQAGNMTFTQICNSCGGRNRKAVNSTIGSSVTHPDKDTTVTTKNKFSSITDTNETCTCIISNETISGMDSRLNGINISEKCGNNVSCRAPAPSGGGYVNVDCRTGVPIPDGGGAQETNAELIHLVVDVVLIIVLGLLLLGGSWIINMVRSHRRQSASLAMPNRSRYR